ncbi:maltokinase N-terminal cap-like domain-containing protein [Spirillospora sp. CA-294931]|uniref:maltokinase N-terminal cap-like domain-containing protein n=1 Tax=Spirillospora sp. CA-294931 TaxID=3240042 RepID=UPI003D8C1E96
MWPPDRALAELLAEWMPGRRWFAGKDRAVRDVSVAAATELLPGDPGMHHVVVDVRQGETSDRYQLLLGTRRDLPERLRPGAIGRLPDGSRWLYDAVHDADLSGLLLSRIAAEARVGPLRFRRSPGAELDTDLAGVPLSAEQSNTSLVYGDAYICKLFRRLAPGVNPDLEINLGLTREGCAHIPAVLGWIELDPGSAAEEPVTLGLLSQFLPTATDGWRLAIASVRDWFAAPTTGVSAPAPPEAAGTGTGAAGTGTGGTGTGTGAAGTGTGGAGTGGDAGAAGTGAGGAGAGAAGTGTGGAGTGGDAGAAGTGAGGAGGAGGGAGSGAGGTSADAGAAGGDFAAEAERLGAATATVHADLAAAFGTAEAPDGEPRDLAARMRRQLDEVRADVPELERYADGIGAAFDALAALPGGLRLQRVHGDYHLGQVLRDETGWMLLDFEGEPARTARERRAPSHPLRDVAGMLRSFEYAARFLLAETAPDASPGSGRTVADLEARARAWTERNRAAFCRGYTSAGGVDPAANAVLLHALELDKAVYEVRYEARNRPSWLPVPLRSLAHHLA